MRTGRTAAGILDGMRCPFCKNDDTRVVDSRASDDGQAIRRRRSCSECGRRFTTVEGEIVLRDEKDIICVLCQGADEKTRVREDTRNVLFYSYAVPGVEGVYLREGLGAAAEIMARFAGGNIRGLTVFEGTEMTNVANNDQ